ncbi:hypothetical protein [Actinoplanes sp. NPDC049118]|uniref:hypothetical protein n=1 Tax=Actinoplanes sp. NPDC049118 TaxID=3155769 RepID=UPI0033D88E2D
MAATGEDQLINDETVFTFDEPEGMFWVEILSAVEEQVWRDDVRVRKSFPALRVTTYEGGRNVSENRRFITLKGRRYSIDEVHVWHDGYKPPHDWAGDHRNHHSIGLVTAAGAPLDWKSPVRHKLREIEWSVRGMFVALHPGWTRTSLRLGLAQRVRQATEEAATHRGKADAAEAVAVKLHAELEAM